MVLLIFVDMRSCLVKERVLAEAQVPHNWGIPRLVQMHAALAPSTGKGPGDKPQLFHAPSWERPVLKYTALHILSRETWHRVK